MKRIYILSIALLALGAHEQFVVGQKTSTRCLATIDRLFQRVPTKKLVLYEVNTDYLLQAEFQENCELSRIDVSPKYFWEYLNPQWNDSEHLARLSDDQYTQLLARIDEIKPLGYLVYRGQGGDVTNSTLWLLDRHERGYVVRRVYDYLGQQEEPMKVISFSVYFIRPVAGKVSDKRLSSIPNPEKRATLKIGGRWYLVDEPEYAKAVIGARGVFRAAGPIS